LISLKNKISAAALFPKSPPKSARLSAVSGGRERTIPPFFPKDYFLPRHAPLRLHAVSWRPKPSRRLLYRGVCQWAHTLLRPFEPWER
jgi:hypothetical protein